MKKLASAIENPKLFKIKATCDGNGWNQDGRTPCYQLWEITALDIRKRIHTDYGGGVDTYYGFVCPDCGCFTELDANEIPPEIKNNTKNYCGSEETKDA